MYWKDHGPAHIHAFHSGDEALVRISDGTIMAGDSPKTPLGWFEIGWHCDRRNLSQTGNGPRSRNPFSRLKVFGKL
jgi:hypothetical protein